MRDWIPERAPVPEGVFLPCEGTGIAYEDAMDVYECRVCGGHGLLGEMTVGYAPIAVLRCAGDDRTADALMAERAPHIERTMEAAG